ncbi:MAG: Uma2 family endonuclease [Cyanobacteriota bacterium]|nr:Uma2 family endonuclease [Cyanobacteriota bacterium]
MAKLQLSNKILTAEEYLNYNDGTDTRYELLNGLLIEMPPESNLNARIAAFLFAHFLKILPFSRICHKDAEIQVASIKASFRIPDLMILSEAGEEALLGSSRNTITLEMPTPLLVIEVVSPDNPARDYRYKRSEYAVRGIPEYWIVDPAKQQISVLTLNEGFYDDVVFQGEQAIVSQVFPNVELTANQILLL